MGEGFWFKCCLEEHKYKKQPIEGWCGVKMGVIRIGAQAEAVQVLASGPEG